jgi:hypothetical protein
MSTGNFNLEVAPQLLVGLLTGAIVDISNFPEREGLPESCQDQPGIYLVDSVVLHCTGKIELGLSERPEPGEVVDGPYVDANHMGYFDHDDLTVRVVSRGIYWLKHEVN